MFYIRAVKAASIVALLQGALLAFLITVRSPSFTVFAYIDAAIYLIAGCYLYFEQAPVAALFILVDQTGGTLQRLRAATYHPPVYYLVATSLCLIYLVAVIAAFKLRAGRYSSHNRSSDGGN